MKNICNIFINNFIWVKNKFSLFEENIKLLLVDMVYRYGNGCEGDMGLSEDRDVLDGINFILCEI